MLTPTVKYLNECWAAALGCSAAQLRDGCRHVVGAPLSGAGVARPWPLGADSVALLTCGEGWILSVPSSLRQRATELCTGRSFSDIAAEGDPQAEEWFARGAMDDERARMRGALAYPTLAKLAGGLGVRCWSHYLHWYSDPSSWCSGGLDAHVQELTKDNRRVWRQWLAWPGPFCKASFTDHFEVSKAFGYVVNRQLVSVAQIQADKSDFAWEFGIDTLPKFRRRGFATAVARRATCWILSQVRIPWYYYDHYNRASAAIPRNAGYFFYAEGLFSHK